MAKWGFSCTDNGGKRQGFTVTAKDYHEAIKKAFERARKNAKGDIIHWDCHLNMA